MTIGSEKISVSMLPLLAAFKTSPNAELESVENLSHLELLRSGLWKECLALRSAESDTRRIRKFLGVVAGVSAAIEVPLLWNNSNVIPDDDRIAPVVVGGIGAFTGGWGILEHGRLVDGRGRFEKLRCHEVLAHMERDWQFVSESTTHFSGKEDASCRGVAVLTEGCTPVRHLEAPVVWLTEPISSKEVVVAAGILVVGAAAVYFGVAEVLAAARVAATFLIPAGV